MVDAGGISDESQEGLSPGTRLGKYEIVRLLGSGGMGAVYEAAHMEIGKRVAVKVLSPAIAAVPGARARFLREAQLTSRVRHPNIVDVTDMGSDGGQTYLVMEFLRGEDLAQRLGRSGPLPAQQLADIMLPVCSAVVEAHKVGITHRDLKPQNIFLAVGPHTVQPKVLDFGISKGNDIVGAGTLTGTGALIGTPFYLAPEQIMDTRSSGPASDQYALGVIMYECLTGQRPFEAENLFVVFQAIVGGNAVPPSQRHPGIPVALEAIVLQAMNLTPALRFPSILALGRALLPFASSRTQSIWEDVFTASAGERSSRASAPTMQTSGSMADRSSERASERVATPGSPAPALAREPNTPQRGGTPKPVAATPEAGRVRKGSGAQTPATAPGRGGARISPLSQGPRPWTANPFGMAESTGEPGRRSRNAKVAVIILGLAAAAGLAGAFWMQQTRTPPATTESPSAATTAQPENSAVSPPSSVGDPAATATGAQAEQTTGAAASASGVGTPPLSSAADGSPSGATVTPPTENIADSPPVGNKTSRRRGVVPSHPSSDDEARSRSTSRPARRSRPQVSSPAGAAPAVPPSPPAPAPAPAPPPRSLNPNGAPVID